MKENRQKFMEELTKRMENSKHMAVIVVDGKDSEKKPGDIAVGGGTLIDFDHISNGELFIMVKALKETTKKTMEELTDKDPLLKLILRLQDLKDFSQGKEDQCDGCDEEDCPEHPGQKETINPNHN